MDKTYVAEVDGRVTKAVLGRLRDGVTLEDGPVTVSSARLVSVQGERSIVELVIHEGRNRIVRRLLDHVGHPVRRLTRTAIGPVLLRGLGTGELRDLTREELGSCSTTPSCDSSRRPLGEPVSDSVSDVGLDSPGRTHGSTPKTACPYHPHLGAMEAHPTQENPDASCLHVPSRLPDQGCEGCARSTWGSWRMLTPARRP